MKKAASHTRRIDDKEDLYCNYPKQSMYNWGEFKDVFRCFDMF